jgi:hypothetical protein
VVDPVGVVIRWEPVTETVDGDPVTITGYQVIVTDEEAEDPDGWARPVCDVHVDDEVTGLPVPDEFVRSDTLYEVEVLARAPLRRNRARHHAARHQRLQDLFDAA